MKPHWPTVPLGNIIRQRKEFIRIDDMQTYKRPRVQLHAKGIIERDTVTGAEIKTKTQQVCRAGEFLVAEIDAKVGGFGVVPGNLDGSLVSSHYFLFQIDETQLDRQFLDYYSRTPAFRDQVAAQGSTNYAAIRPGHVLGYTIPLPAVTEQRRIVARIEQLAAQIEAARRLHHQATEETEALVGASQQEFFVKAKNRVPVANVAAVIDPNPSHRYPAYTEDGIPMISSSDFVGDDGIDPSNAKKVPLSFYEETLGRFGVGDGDIIFSRKGKVGYARLHPSGVKYAMTHTLCVLQPDRKQVLPRYLLHFSRSPAFVDHLSGTMNPNLGVPTLGLGVIRDALISVPPLAEQRRLVAYLDGLAAQVARLARLQTETAAELDALLPSILDKAFKGEL